MSYPFKAFAIAALSVFGVRTEVEPPYQVIDTVGPLEIRTYDNRLAAEVTVPDNSESSGRSDAFNLLAAYIFGGNRGQQQIAMTAPVQTESGNLKAARLPDQMATSAPRMLTMRFFLPAEISRANAPLPYDNRVQLVDLPPETIAVLCYSGGWSAGAVRQRYEQLTTTLLGTRWVATGDPFSLFYDPPFTLPPLRRNEAAIRVSHGSR